MAFRPNWNQQPSRGPGALNWREWTGLGTVARITVGVSLFVIILESFGMHGVVAVLDRMLALHPPLPLTIWSLFLPLQLIGYTLLHADVFHLLMNMWALWIFGSWVEASIGKAAFLRLYVGAAVLGALGQTILATALGSHVPTVGASGGVMGVMALCALREPKRTISLIFPPGLQIPIWLLVLFYLLIDLSGLQAELKGAGGSVAVACHLGGAVYGLFWFKRGDVVQRFTQDRKRAHQQKERDKHEDDRREMDQILAKVQQGGLQSLTPRERAFLDRRSRELRNQQ